MSTFDQSTALADRGVSEVISFLLLFAVLIGVSITGAVFGIESLEEASRGDDVHAAIGAMETVRSDMYDLGSGAVYRSTEIGLNSGSLRYAEPVNITITADSGGETVLVQSVRPQPVVYDLGSVQVIYSAGAVVQDQPDGGVVKVGPAFRIDTEQAILLVVNSTFAAGPAGIGGRGTGYVVGYRVDDAVQRFEPTDPDGTPIETVVTVSIETPRTEPWRLYFESSPQFDEVTVDSDSETVTAEFVTKRLYVKVTDVDVRLDI